MCSSCLTSCLATLDLGSSETRKYQRNLKVCWRQSYVSSLPYRNNTVFIAGKNYRKPHIKVFLILLVFAWFLYFVPLIFSGMVCRQICEESVENCLHCLYLFVCTLYSLSLPVACLAYSHALRPHVLYALYVTYVSSYPTYLTYPTWHACLRGLTRIVQDHKIKENKIILLRLISIRFSNIFAVDSFFKFVPVVISLNIRILSIVINNNIE